MANKKSNLPSATDEAVQTVAKQKRNWVSNPQKDFGQELVKPGDNARYLRHALSSVTLPPIDLDSDEQVTERIQWYFADCENNDMKPTVSGMAAALGIDRHTLYDWKTGYRRGKSDNRTQIISKAYRVLEILWEDYMQNGKINPVSGIFIGKNHFGYTNKQEIVVTPNNPLGEMDDMEEVRQRYLESIPEDTEGGK